MRVQGSLRVNPDQALVIASDIVTTFALINADFTFGSHIYLGQYTLAHKDTRGEEGITVKVLIRMHTGILGSRPASRINTGSNPGRIGFLPPLDEQGDGIFSLSDTAQVDSSTHGSRGINPDGNIIRLHHAITDINMVRIQIIRDITLLARPRLERLQLTLGLAHVTIEVIKVTQGACFSSRIRIRRVEPLMMLDKHKHTMFARFVHESQMVGQVLRRRLRDQYVNLALDRIQGYRVVRRIRGEYRDRGAGLQRVYRGLVCVWVCLVVCWVRREGDV